MGEPFVWEAAMGSNSNHLPQPVDLSHHLSSLARRRQASSIKQLYKYMTPGVLNLAGGMPHPSYFPFDTLEATTAFPDRFAPPDEGSTSNGLLASAFSKLTMRSGGNSNNANKPAAEPQSDHFTIGRWDQPESGKPEDTINLASALQYSQTVGYPPLMKWIREFNSALHGVIPYDHPEVCITDGSTDGISRAMGTLLDPDEHLLVEEHAFGTALSCSRSWGVKAAPVPMDKHGLIPDALTEMLETWDTVKLGKRPHVLYTITIGQNPTGTRLPLHRRKEIYKIAQKFDLIIVEDDPYWFLQFKDQLPKEHQNRSKYPFFNTLAPSYLTLDCDGRVIRLDTFSKTICPGARCGWITAAPMFIERFILHAEAGAGTASGFVQSMLASLLSRWDMDGWVTWLEGLRDEYEKRRNVMIDALHRGFASEEDDVVSSDRSRDYVHLSTAPPLASFDPPAGGMFLWVTIRIETHPHYRPEKKRELMDALWEHLAENKCLVSPGWIFATTDDIAQNHCEHLRMCFAAIEESKVEAASELFGKLVKQWFSEAHRIAQEGS